MQNNINKEERIASVAAGIGILLGNRAANSSLKVSFAKYILAGFLLFRGLTGLCPAYKLLKLNSLETARINS